MSVEELTLPNDSDSFVAARLRETLQKAAEDATELHRRGWRVEVHIVPLEGVFAIKGEQMARKYSPMLKITREVTL